MLTKVVLSKKIQDFLVLEYEAVCCRRYGNGFYKNWVYLLGKKPYKGVVTAKKLRHIPGVGCEQMHSIYDKSLVNAYLELNKEKTIACGLARVGPDITGGWYSSNSGDSIMKINDGFVLTINSPYPTDWIAEHYIAEIWDVQSLKVRLK